MKATAHAGRLVAAFAATTLVLTCGPLVTSQSRASSQTTIVNGHEAVSGEVLVKFTTPLAARDRLQLEQQIGAEASETVGQQVRRIRSARFDVQTLLAFFRTHPAVAYAEPNYIWHASLSPDDPSFPSLWGLLNTGQTISGRQGVAGADIHATGAWDVSTGSTANVVTVIDTGIDYTHPDLIGNVWCAPSDFTVTIGGLAIDCAAGTHGFNAITKSCDPMDDNRHGTHVSGTIGASGNNGLGVVGVNWTASIMGSKFLDASGNGNTADAINAIEFAIQAKAVFASTAGANVRVLSNSWSGGAFSQALLDEINSADANGMLFVAAAGNNGRSNDTFPVYPASYTAPNVLAVAATDNTDSLASFSNYGASVALAAPGVDVLSTTPGNTYSVLSGTSMATPHVAGSAALILSACDLDTAALKSAIVDNVDVVGALTGWVATDGRLNVDRALRSCASPSPPAAPANLTAAPGDQQITLTWTESSGADNYTVKRGSFPGGPYTDFVASVTTTSYTSTGLTNGQTYYYVVTASRAGLESGPSNEASATPQPPDGGPPSPWVSQDVGDTGQAGSASFAGGVFTVSGSGADIWGSADAFQYVYQPLDGDGQIVARVTGVENTNPFAKAGVMLRETAAAGAAHVILDVRPDGSLELMTRQSPDGPTAFVNGTTQAPPAWLKLVRTGSTVTGFASPDGTSWTTVGTTSVTMSSTAFVGLIVTSHDTTRTNTSMFDSVAVTATPALPPAAPESPSPAPGATGVPTNTMLSWTAAGATSYDVRLGTTNTPPEVMTGQGATSYAPALAAGTTYFWQVVAHNGAGATAGPVWLFTTAAGGGGLPSPWANQDVGDTGLAGNASFAGGVFSVNGSGGDIWGSVDAFQYVYQSLDGDGQIVVRVTGVENTNAFAKAGVMLRETMAAGAAHVILDVRPDGSVELMTRETTDGPTTFINGATQAPPAWLMLVRAGSTVTGYASADGTSWTTVGTTSVTMSSMALVGLIVTSHDTARTNTSMFDSVAVTAAPSPPAVPGSPSPAPGAAGVATNTTLFWTAAGATSYDVRFGTTNTPPEVMTGQAATSYAPALAAGTTYFWQIVAHNSAGATTGPMWLFTTAADGGALPIPWANDDVGDTGLGGNALFAGVFTVSGSGADI
jgi:subtilisin family serine protease